MAKHPEVSEVVPIMSIWVGSARKGIFVRPQVYGRLGISVVEVYERVGKSVIWV